MIEAVNLTKRYGDKVAVDHISFTVAPGTVTGFPQLRLTEGSSFTAIHDSEITLIGSDEGLDAAAGVTITVRGAGENKSLVSGGCLVFLA